MQNFVENIKLFGGNVTSKKNILWGTSKLL